MAAFQHYLQTLKFEFHIISTDYKLSFGFLYHRKNVKTILCSQATKKQAVDWISYLPTVSMATATALEIRTNFSFMSQQQYELVLKNSS